MLLPTRFRKTIRALGWSVIALLWAGCAPQEDTLLQVVDKARNAGEMPRGLLTSLEESGEAPDTAGQQRENEDPAVSDGDGEVDANRLTDDASQTAPFPDRTNPFEFAEGVDFDAPQTSQNENLEIKLYGFVGTEQPKAAISVGGRTKLLAAGEKWGVLEVIEVAPPQVRIKTNGMIRVWSLLGQR